MLGERSVGEGLWGSVLSAGLRGLPPELGRVDAILDDDRLLAAFRGRLSARVGRPTIPIETYLRLVYLRHRYGLGYETLCREVADSLSWRRFCRIALEGRVPDPSRLMKLTRRLGPELLEELNAELLSLAVERGVLRSRRLRVDTTVVGADVRSRTDSGLCAQAVSRLTRLGKRIEAAGLATESLRDRRRSVGRRVRGDLGGAGARPAGVADARPADRGDRRAGRADGARGARARSERPPGCAPQAGRRRLGRAARA
jgi:transposase, IS5 family